MTKSSSKFSRNYSKMTKQRLIWADSLKGWLMLLVILGHAIQCTLGVDCEGNHLWNIIYSFHMPAFMAVSGWLAYRGIKSSKPTNADWGGYISSCKRRAQQLLLPYLAWTLISYMIKGDYTLIAVYNKLMFPDTSFWFLWVLFWICVIFNLAQLVASKQKVNEMVLILGTCLLLFGVMVVMEIRVLGFQFLAYYFLFYSLGYCLHKYERTKCLEITRNNICLIILTLLWAFLAWGWSMHGLPSWMPTIPHVPSSLLQYAYRGFTALVAIVVLIGVAPKALNGTGKTNQMICSLGVISLGLYVVHLSLIGHIVKGVLAVIPDVSTWLCVAIAFVLALAVSYLVVWALNMNKHTARIFLGKI